MKKSYKSLVAIAMALSLAAALPTTVFADQATSGTVTGDNTVSNVTLDVIVPTTLTFALDPLELKTTAGSQIASTDYVFVNKTGAPVQVGLDFTTTLASGVTLVSDPSTLKQDDTSVTTKNIYFAALGATGISKNAPVFTYAVGTNDPVGSYDATKADTLTPFSTDGKATMEFALGKATDSKSDGVLDTLAASNAGVAAFQFYAKMNTYAAWAAKDVTVSGAYTLTPLRATTFANYTTNSAYTADGLNQLTVAATPVVPVYTNAGFINGTSTTTLTTLATAVTDSKASTTDISIPFYFNSLTVKSLATGTYVFAASEYSISGNNLVLAKGSTSNVFNTSSIGSKTMTLTLSDNSTYTFTVNVTA